MIRVSEVEPTDRVEASPQRRTGRAGPLPFSVLSRT